MNHSTFQKIELVLKRTSSNIIFSNGMNDPWSRGSVLRNISDSIVALVTKKGEDFIGLFLFKMLQKIVIAF